MPSFSAGQTLALSLDFDDYISFTGQGIATITPTTGSLFVTYLTGSQTLGPYKQFVNISIATSTAGSYTQNSQTAVDQTAVLSVDASGNVNGLMGVGGGPTMGVVVSVIPSGDTTGATDYATMVAAHAALPTAGGRIAINSGVFDFGTNKITFTKPVQLTGVGSSDGYASGGDTAATKLRFNTSTGDGIEFQGVGSSARGVHVSNQSTSLATAGAAFVVNGAHGVLIENCSTFGFFDGCRIDVSQAPSINSNKFYSYARCGLYVSSATADEGDQTVIGNWFCAGGKNNATPTAGIIWVKGGGMKAIGNKINREPPALASTYWHNNGILFQPLNGVVTGTFIIADNSIENGRADALVFDGSAGGTGSLSNIHIYANQFQSWGSGALLSITGTGTFPFNGMSFQNSQAKNCAGAVVANAYVNGLAIGSIEADNFTGQALFIGLSGGISQTVSTCNGITYDLTKITLSNPQATSKLLIDYTTAAADSHFRGPSVQKLSREVPNLGASVPLATNVATLILNTYQGARAKFILSGNFAGVGSYVCIVERAFTTDGSGNITATTIGTDFNTGSKIVTITFTLAVNSITVVLTTVAALGLAAPVVGCGTLTIEADGNFREMHRLN